MSGKNQFPVQLNWQDANPALTFLPNSNTSGSAPSGNPDGDMSATIYSQIMEVSRMDNIGVFLSWVGDAVGTLEIQVSNPGDEFSTLTFSPGLAQPSGSDGFYTISLNQLPFKYWMVKYTASTGTGTLQVTAQNKDLN